MTLPQPLRRLRSFVRRDSRITDAQERAYANQWPSFGLNLSDGLLDIDKLFGRLAPRRLEIGYGMGVSLLAAASAYPEMDFIGVETHKPGVGALMSGIEAAGLTNLRTFHGDVIDILANCVPDASLDSIQIFFPDPWQKRRHHARRLVQADFIKKIIEKIKPAGQLHLATDWEDYAKQMMLVLSTETQLTNAAGKDQFAERSPYRPILSKFEKRAHQEGRGVWDLQFYR
ncbi:MAG: tRNA (guanosine(46)-N7)-methyltransferase TrmB [Gammaproteobacteria bacterium]